MGIIRYYGNDINKVALRYFSSSFLGSSSQGFEREKDGNRGKFIGSDLVIFCSKEFEKSCCANLLANRKPHLLFILSQSKTDM